MKLFNDKNITALLKARPSYILIVVVKSVAAVFKRKLNVYSKLKITRKFSERVNQLNLNDITIDFGKENFWNNEFRIKQINDLNWSFSRNYKLKDFFKSLIGSESIKDTPLDKEEYWSAMQLNWLFYEVRHDEISYESSQSLIIKACSFMNNNKTSWIYRQFTISEMITNIVKIQLYYGKDLKIDKQSKKFIKEGVEFILNNLEIYSTSNKTSLNHTNNHILSNVRALFWATKFFKDRNLYELASEVYKKYCINLFQDGILDEGSTIYHFIAAQCIYDISFFVNLEDLPRVDNLIMKMKQNNFLSESTFPVVGDVSPDPNMASVINDALRISNILTKNKLILDKITDYELTKYKDWSIFMHSRTANKHIQHSHNDYGSPVLNYKDINIIIDLGRPSYVKKHESEDFTSTKFHNVPQIDNLDQSPRSKRDIYPYKFLIPKERNNLDVVNEKFKNSNKYLILFKKNYRLFPNSLYGGSWDRLFVLNKIDSHKIYIEDNLTIDYLKPVVFRFFVPEKVIIDSIVSYEFYKNGKIVSYKQKKVLCNSSYGEVKKAYLFEIYSDPATNHQLLTKIKINNE